MILRFLCLTKRAALLFVLVGCVYLPALAHTGQQLARITYTLSMPEPASHLFEVGVEVELTDAATTDALDFQMPRWSPGRYAIFDFAKNVQEVAANSTGHCAAPTPCAPRPLSVTRVDNQTWRVPTSGSKTVEVSYKVFGDDLSGTFSQLDERHANINGASVFMYIVGHKQDPVTLRVNPPPRWRIINAATRSADQREWRFPNYDILIDTPTEIAPDFTVDEFTVDGKLYRVVVHSFGNERGERPRFVRDIERLVRAEIEMWGAPELESYTFLIHFANDGESGDGMEHLTSTQIIESGALGEPITYASAIDTVAHEFFHVWNVKRLRPVELGPWDFTRPVNTRSLWIAEGITNYYGHLMQRRARLWADADVLRTFSQVITGVENAPGSRLMSAEDSSISAPFLDGAPHAQRTNLSDTSVNYYFKGEALGLVLDLLIRGRSRGRASLDDVLRRMYDEFYLRSATANYYLRGRGYTPQDFERAVAEVAGADFSSFFEHHVRRAGMPPYDEALAAVGLRLIREPQASTAGITLGASEQTSMKITNVRPSSPAARAGLLPGDTLISIGGTNVNRANWQATLGKYQEGASVTLNFQRHNRAHSARLTLGPPERYTYRIEEKKDASPQERQRRQAWLDGRMSAER